MRVIQYQNGREALYQPCIDQVRRSLPSGQAYTFFEGDLGFVQNCADYRAMSNIVRCRLAMEHETMLWLDTDIIIRKWMVFETIPGKVYFNKGMNGHPENCAFYVNRRCDFFHDMWKFYEENKPTDIWWFNHYVRSRIDEIEFIPEGIFTHLMLSKAINAGDHFNCLIGPGYSITRNKFTGELKVEVK